MTTATEKPCSKCGEVKPLSGYHRDAKTRDGHWAMCKVCVSVRDKAYYEANREGRLGQVRAYYAERWATDPEYRARMNAAKTRRRRMLANAKQEPYTRESIFQRDGWVCRICSESIDPTIRYTDDPGACATIDHVIPLSRGGDDTPANVQAAHGSCNYGKCDRVEDEDAEAAA